MNIDRFVVEIMRVVSRHEQKVNELERCLDVDNSNIRLDIFDIVLDALGVPPENALIEVEGSQFKFCRDFWDDEFYNLMQGKSRETTIEEFPEWVRKTCSIHD